MHANITWDNICAFFLFSYHAIYGISARGFQFTYFYVSLNNFAHHKYMIITQVYVLFSFGSILFYFIFFNNYVSQYTYKKYVR